MQTVIAAGGYFDVRLKAMVKPGFITVDGEVIVDVSVQEPVAHEGDRYLDLSTMFLLPGLIDTHVHLSFDPENEDCLAPIAGGDRNALRAMIMRHGKQAAVRGVTTLRDLGDADYAVADIRVLQNQYLPTIVASGPPITSVHGHCHYLGGSVENEEGALRLVRQHHSRDVDLIKIMVTGGILTEGSDPAGLQFDECLVASVVHEAHLLGNSVAAHAHTAAGIRLSLNAHVDSIEHCTFGTTDYFAYDDVLANDIANSKTWVCPTFVERPGVNWDATRLNWRRTVLKNLYSAGVRLIAGTDAGVIRGLHFDTLPWCVVSMTNAGLSPADAIMSGTWDAAVACGLESLKGKLAPGKDADIVGVARDPLADDLETILTPQFVMMRGKVIKSETYCEPTDGN